jgi:beta-N-acetylhexosaminidase
MSGGAGRVLWIGLPGVETGPALHRLREVRPGGLVLFRRNVESAAQVHALVRALRREAGQPGLPVALDQEGGRVDRLAPLLGPSPSARRLAGEGPGVAWAFGALTARALRLLGLNVDFAPVVDLDHGQEAGAIGDRSWGREPGRVVEAAGAFLAGLSSEGVSGCLKHWPGLGRACADPHHDLPRVEVNSAEMEEEVRPFLDLLPDAPLVMTAHCLYSALGADQTPATCCAASLAPLRRAGFQGCLVADDLEMGAIAETGEAAAASLEAGCDALLVCGPESGPVLSALRALEARTDLEERLDEGAARLAGAVPGHTPPDRFDEGAWEDLREEYRRFCDPLLESAPAEDPTEAV